MATPTSAPVAEDNRAPSTGNTPERSTTPCADDRPCRRCEYCTAPRLTYWQKNVDPSRHKLQCPQFLRNISPKDRDIVNSLDEDFKRITWSKVTKIVGNNEIADFQRVPSELRRYLEFKWKVERHYGSIRDFILRKRLGWEEPIFAAAPPFLDEGDYKILYNDWPYGVDKDITHLVVWCKFDLDEDPKSNWYKEELHTMTKMDIQDFITDVFHAPEDNVPESQVQSGTPQGKVVQHSRIPKDRLVWFKNYDRLKSVHDLEHFHIMIYDPKGEFKEFITKITNGDIPLYEKLEEWWEYLDDEEEQRVLEFAPKKVLKA